MDRQTLIGHLGSALSARSDFFDDAHESAFRLFNGFYEGFPELALDIYARTLVAHNYADPPEGANEALEAVHDFLHQKLPWVRTIILKTRNSPSPEERRGVVTFGDTPDRKVLESGVWYAIDLTMNRDASLYLDTRNVRKWAIDHLKGLKVLNTFAYTGSFGVAALAGGAKRVIQLDLNRKFLNVAKSSYMLNGIPIVRSDFINRDFFSAIARLKREGDLFDCVFLDPPIFSSTSKGTVDLVGEGKQLINKVRPLVADGGWLVAINNALFLSGQEYISMLTELCADGYLRIERLIPVPDDFTGFPGTVSGKFVTEPAPFNHPTKIAMLNVRRKIPA